MSNIIIDEYFRNTYLTPGNTYDNFVFENCPEDFLIEAEKLLKTQTNNNMANIIKLTNLDEQNIQQTLSQCKSDFQKIIISRDYICSLIMNEVLSKLPNTQEQSHKLREFITATQNGDYNTVINSHSYCPMPFEITQLIKKHGNNELDIFLISNQDKFLQGAINNFLSARTPYSIKVFTNNEHLPSSTDQAGNLIESPHDFMRKNIRNFITIKDCTQQK